LPANLETFPQFLTMGRPWFTLGRFMRSENSCRSIFNRTDFNFV